MSKTGYAIPLLLFGTGAVIAYGYVSTGLQLQDLEYDIAGARLKKGSNILESKVYIDLAIDNPNKNTVNFQEFRGKLYYNSKLLSEIYIKKVVPIKGYDITVLKDIQFKVSNAEMINQLLGLILGDKVANCQLIGKLKVEGLPAYDIDETFELTS